MPFFLVAGLGFASALLPPYSEGGVELWLMLLAFGVSLTFLGASLRRGERTWVDPVGPFLFFVTIALGRDLTGGTESGLGALIALPVLWLALTGTRGDLWVASVLTPLLFLAPLVLIGAPHYDTVDVRRAIGWTAFTLCVAPIIQRMVQQLAEETRRVRESSAELAHQEARWRVLLDHLPDTTVVVFDQDRTVKVVAGAGVAVQNLRASEGMALAEVANAANNEVLGDLLDEAFRGREATGEILASTTGSEHEVVATPLPPEGGEPRALILARDVSRERERERALMRSNLRAAHLADHDLLTGLANRRSFERRLEAHLERCRRFGPSGALLLIDLDHFKDVNDTLGHPAGDELLIAIAALLEDEAGSADLVARIGGDEFAVLLAAGDRNAAEGVARAIVARIREHTAGLEGTRRRVTASVGAVSLQAASWHADDVLALADMTMYDAKEAGRNQYVVLAEDSARPPRSAARLQWKSRIERALEHDDFVLHLQPIRELRTGAIHSAEALIRLRDRDELVPPSRFLYIAERAGLIPAVDAWVVERAVGILARLRALDPGFRLEVNLSGLSIGLPETEHVIVDSLRRHSVDPSALILEITETAAVTDVGLAREFAERMTTLGCKFALDDFGAGFGSFYYLKHLMFDFVKIDGEFVSNCHRSEVDRTILRSIVGIARDLGKETVAEFVSEPAILDVVRAEGVDHAQGFLVGKPAPYDEFVTSYLGPGRDRGGFTSTDRSAAPISPH